MRICIISTMFDVVLGRKRGALGADGTRGPRPGARGRAWCSNAGRRSPRRSAQLRSRGAKVFFRTVNLSRRWNRAFEYLVYPFPSIVRWAPEAILISQSSLYDLMYRNDVHRLLRALKLPYTTVIQQVCENQFPIGSEYFRERLANSCRRAHRVAFVADGNRKVAERQLGIDLPNSCIVRNPTNLDRCEIARLAAAGYRAIGLRGAAERR